MVVKVGCGDGQHGLQHGANITVQVGINGFGRIGRIVFRNA